MSIPTEASKKEQLSRFGCHGHLYWPEEDPGTWLLARTVRDVIDDTTAQTVIGKDEVPIDLSFLEEEETLGKDQAGVQHDLGSPERRTYGSSKSHGPNTWDGSAVSQAHQSAGPSETRRTDLNHKRPSTLSPRATAFTPAVQCSQYNSFPPNQATGQITGERPKTMSTPQYDLDSFLSGNGLRDEYVAWQPNTTSAPGVWKAPSTEHNTAHPPDAF